MELTQKKFLKIKKLLPYLVVIICSLVVYIHQFIPVYSLNYIKHEKQYLKNIQKRTLALDKIKTIVNGTKEHNEYLKIKATTEDTWKKFRQQKISERYFGFKSFHYFIERFGLMLCIFVYTLYNLYTSFRNEPKNTGAKIVHSFIISVCFFYFYWIFQQFQDVSKITYYFMTFASAFIVTLAVYLITQYRKDTIAQLKRKLFLVSKSALLHTPIDKKEKLYQEFKDIAKE